MSNDINDYLRVFTRLENPIFLSIFIIFIFILTVYAFVKYIIIPLKKGHLIERKKLEQQNLRNLALFSELSPDPLWRLDINGRIIAANGAAKELFPAEILTGRFIHDVLKAPIDLFAQKGNFTFQNKNYSYHLRRLEPDDLILLYQRDITESVEYEKKLKEVSKYAQDKVELERQRIAVELHDGIGQNLSLAKLKLFKYIKSNHHQNEPEDLTGMNNILDNAIGELKQISYNLKPRVLDEMGFAPALRCLCEDTSRQSGIKIKSEIVGPVIRLPKSIEASLYRIIQEAISNIIKHSHADECRVRLKYSSKKLFLSISDNGIGFDPESTEINKKSLGLFNMKQRVEEMDGSFKIESIPGQGTILFVEINIRTNDE